MKILPDKNPFKKVPYIHVQQKLEIAAPGDETDTDLERSDDGASFEEDHNSLGSLQLPSIDRRKRANRRAIYTLISFFLLMFLVLVLSYRGKNTESTKRSNVQSHGGSQVKTQSRNPGARVYCGDDETLSLSEWFDVGIVDTSELCDPYFHPESVQADMSRPVKVFIMIGEANMVGAGQTFGDVLGTLEYTVKNKNRFGHLVDDNKEWRERQDVRYVAVRYDMDIVRNEWLGVKEEHGYFGPELQFGYIIGELFDDPVLLIKASSGHHSLGGDLLPPGSSRYEYGGWNYAGYGDRPRRWPIGTDPGGHGDPTWYAGHAYDTTRDNILTILKNIAEYYPGAREAEIAGIAFWHGDSDRRDPAYADMYQRNLRAFIKHIRSDLKAPNAKFAIASIGQGGDRMSQIQLQVFDSQMEIATAFPEFHKNVYSIDIRSSWRTPFLPGYEGDRDMMDIAHYGRNAETVMEVGNALGLGMAKLLHGL